jgi:DNA-binding LacI/PurR family transcriptional regulator
MRVPETLSVVGMVSEPMAEIATPALTTIKFPADEIGDVAARILLGRVVGGRTAPQQVLVRPTLTVRDSTGKPPQ